MADHRLTLTIILGNAAMSTPDDVASALYKAAARAASGFEDGAIRDANGNRVGEWTVTYPPNEDDAADFDADSASGDPIEDPIDDSE